MVIETETISIPRLREETLLNTLHLYELGLAAMGGVQRQQAEELRNRQLATVGLQTT